MKFYKNKKIRRLIPLLLVIVLAAVGVSFAWSKQEVSVENKLKAHTTDVTVDEEFNHENGTKKVQFTNNGTSSVFLRMTWTEYWETADGKILSNKVNGQEIASKQWTEAYGAQWGKAEPDDGWYYYKQILESGKATDLILTKVTFPDNYETTYPEYKDAEYHLYFQVEAVQASDSAGTLNSAEVNADATWTTWGKTATVDQDGNVTWSADAPGQEGGDNS